MTKNAKTVTACALLAVCGWAWSVPAQDSKSGVKTDPQAADAGAGENAMRAAMAAKGGGGGDDDLKPFTEVSKGYEKVVSNLEGKSFYGLWRKEKDGGLLAEMPRGWESQKHFFAMTVATGELYAGLQSGTVYAYWKKVDNRLVLVEPQISVRSTGDSDSKNAVKQIFTDRVILDVPIVATGPSGQPVIDLKSLLTNNAGSFFGPRVAGVNTRLATLKSAKAFENNIEISYVMPNRTGRMQEYHYSISLIPDSTGYTPRVADNRVGFFTTNFRDLGKGNDQDKWVRYVNRWHVEKRDPKLAMSPPKKPIVFYIDTAVPVKYRQAVRDGVLRWNKAFEKIGIINALEVYQQDAETGQHMDKDAEDVNYNFIRWLANDQGTAIGPSRVHPLTGQILDADVVLTDGWIRHFWYNFNELLPDLAMEGMSPETLAWLETRPQWDPRFRLAEPGKRNMMMAERGRRGVLAYGGHPIAMALEGEPNGMVGVNEYDGLANRTSQMSGLCMAARGKSLDVAWATMMSEMISADGAGGDEALGMMDDTKGDKKDDKKDEKKEKRDPDNVPDWFVTPLLADLTCHEVGHTIGLRHNFKASSQYTLAEIKSDAVKGKKSFAASVMDYNPINILVEDGKIQGDVGMIGIGDYDQWAIEFGYTTGDTKEILKRVGTPGLDYGTDEDTSGPDPYARPYDFAKDTLNWAKERLKLVQWHRERLISRFAKDGQSWARVRRGYNITLSIQMNSISSMARWVGGTFVNRDLKGDPAGRKPLETVPAKDQRDALAWIIENSFRDAAFGLTPELLEKMTVEKWWDEGGMNDVMSDATYPIHDRLAGIQSSVMTMLVNPTTLRRVFDNEAVVPADQDAITLPEVLDTIQAAVWTELDKGVDSKYTARKPMISSLRRNLQKEHLDRMVDLTLPGAGFSEAYKPISALVRLRLQQTKDKIDAILKSSSKAADLDPYTLAHFTEASKRIEIVLNPQFIYNQGGGMDPFLMFLLSGQGTGQNPLNGGGAGGAGSQTPRP